MMILTYFFEKGQMKEVTVDREDENEWQGAAIPDSIGHKADPFTVQSYSQMNTRPTARLSRCVT